MQEDLGSFAGSRSVTYQYDTTGTGTRGRLTYLGLGLTSALGGEYNFTYGYHAVARLNQIWTFTYTYLANSNLIAAISDSASSWTQTRTYEASQPLLDVIETKLAVATKARFDYANDALGRRTSVAKTGEMYARYSAAGLDTHSGYNDRAEVTREQSRLGVSAGGEYLLQLKGNAPAVQAATVLAVTSTCTVKKTGATSTETRLFVSSAAAKACTPRQWLARRRGHWSVESANHYRRDVTWREDAELGRKAACACNLAPIRSALFGALLRDGPLNLSADTQRCIARPGAALRFLRAAHPSHEPNRKAVTRTAAARYLSCS
jgi:hypothetical protein